MTVTKTNAKAITKWEEQPAWADLQPLLVPSFSFSSSLLLLKLLNYTTFESQSEVMVVVK